MTVTEKLTHADLQHFTGTSQWYRHPLMRKVLFTDGVHFLIKRGECMWLIDKIATLQLKRKVAAEPHQFWNLKVNEDRTAELTCDDGDKGGGRVILHREKISFTDFPLDGVEVWVEYDGEHAVILLPSEH